METNDMLCYAINNQQKITFEYHKPGEAEGKRYGNPHILFLSTKNNPTLHVWQTGGDLKKTDKREFPHWSLFLLEFIRNVEILEEKFEVTNGVQPYKPNSPLYGRVLCKI